MNIASMPKSEIQVKVCVPGFHDVIVMVPLGTFTSASTKGVAFNLASSHV
jgi:hypothetical protein